MTTKTHCPFFKTINKQIRMTSDEIYTKKEPELHWEKYGTPALVTW